MFNFSIGKYYSFNTLAPAILGATFYRAKLIGLVCYDTANTRINVNLMQRTIYPSLPAGTVDNPANYTYLMLETESGEKTVVAYEWIDESSIEEVVSMTATITVPNIAASDATAIRDLLTLNGFKNIKIALTSVAN